MFCVYCRKKIDNDTIYCPYCGKSQKKKGEPLYVDSKTPVSNKVQSENVPEANNQKIIIILLAVAVVVLAFVSGVFFVNLQNDKSLKEQGIEENDTETEVQSDMEDPDANKNEGGERELIEDGGNAEEVIDVSTEEDFNDEEDSSLYEDYDDDLEMEFILPDSDTRILSTYDLSGLSRDELRIARNEIYARRGRLFDDPMLQQYFDSKEWYHGTILPSSWQEDTLNYYEKANRDLIVEHERKMGY